MAVIWERGLYRKGTGEGTSPLRQPNFGRLISLNRDREKISIALAIRSVDLLPRGDVVWRRGTVYGVCLLRGYGCWIWQSSRSGFIGAGVEPRRGDA